MFFSLRRFCSSVWADCFTEDAHYIEHAYGELDGRAAIRDWITKVMAPYPRMTFPEDWCVFDTERGAVVFQCQNRFPAPSGWKGGLFQFPTWTRLVSSLHSRTEHMSTSPLCGK